MNVYKLADRNGTIIEMELDRLTVQLQRQGLTIILPHEATLPCIIHNPDLNGTCFKCGQRTKKI